jgi:hypothetical protein
VGGVKKPCVSSIADDDVEMRNSFDLLASEERGEQSSKALNADIEPSLLQTSCGHEHQQNMPCTTDKVGASHALCQPLEPDHVRTDGKVAIEVKDLPTYFSRVIGESSVDLSQATSDELFPLIRNDVEHLETEAVRNSWHGVCAFTSKDLPTLFTEILHELQLTTPDCETAGRN